MNPYTLRAGLPGGRSFAFRCRTTRDGVMALRRLAARLGVSALALEWSVEPVK